MSTVVNTAAVAGRRHLHFQSIADIAADVERLARAKDIDALGNWSAGRVCQHLANSMNRSIDGFAHHLPAPLRWFIRLCFKNRFLNRPMSPGFKLPDKAAAELVPPDPVSLAEGLEAIRMALRRLDTETKREPHPALGRLTADEWVRMHCRHSELHLSFLVPSD